MAYDGRVYRILIASPSDVADEREIAVRVIQEWNDLYSYTRKVVLLPLRWETHTAPEYGVRPQEAINRAIVDNCDLLLGVFWTRIGTPTGEADSGTLEEIKRVANAGKPVMLYFSKVGIDPGKLDLDQVARLNEFKETTYPNGLIESFKSQIEFRDKFSKQLELKVRDLQKDDTAGFQPLTAEFASLDSGKLIGNHLTQKVMLPKLPDISTELESKSKKARSRLQKAIQQSITRRVTMPIVLAISNTSSSGVRNIFAEIQARVITGEVEISDSAPTAPILDGITFEKYLLSQRLYKNYLQISDDYDVEAQIKRLHSEKFEKTDNGCRFAFEWGAIQPQRVRFVSPALFITPKESCNIDFQVNVFADSFPQPVTLKARLELTVIGESIELVELLPDYEKLLAISDEDEDVIDAEFAINDRID